MSDQPAVTDTCGKMVDGQVASYPCDIDVNHKGPCAAPEVPVSIERRKQWQAQQEAPTPQQDDTLSQFQGVPQTTAERYTESPTPHPAAGVPERPSQPRSFARGAQAMARCQSCAAGRHWACEVIEMNRGAVDVQDFVDVTCSCWAQSPDTHQEIAASVEAEGYLDDDPTKQREGDQVLPEPNDHFHAHDLLIEDIAARQRLGIQRYGTPLQPFNGRDTLQDALDEVLDLAVYLRALKAAAEADRAVLVERVTEAMGGVASETGGAFSFDDLAKVAVDVLLREAPVR